MTVKQYRRDLAVNAPTFIEENDERIVELAFSSEAPYSRIYTDQNGDPVELKEVLLHGEENVDLTVINDNASLLWNHNFDDHIGVVVAGSARIDADRVGRALVKFSKVGQLANETFEKVKEGSLSKVSVGYSVLDGYADFNKGIYYVTRWQPYELTICSVPADHSVGISRSLNTSTDEPANNEEQREVEVETQEQEQTPVEEIKPEVEETRSEEEQEKEETESEESNSDSENPSNDPEIVEEEVEQEEVNTNTNENEEERAHETETVETENIEEVEQPFTRSQEDTDEIRAIGKKLNISEDEIQRCLEDKEITVESFKQRALNIITESKTFVKGKNTMTDTIKNLEAKFDLNKAVRSIATGKALDGVELEYSQEQARVAAQRGRSQRTNSVFIPASALRSGQNMASLAPVVGEEIRHDCFVDMIVQNSILGKLGVRTINATGPVSLPSLTSSNLENFGFVAEGQSAGEGSIKFAAQPMTLKTFNGVIPVTRQAAITLPNIGAIVGEHMIKHSRIALEKAILGATENANARAGVAKMLKDAGKVKQIEWTHKGFLKLIAELTDAGYAESDLAFATRGVVKADLAATLKDAGVPGFMVENDKLANRPIYGSGVIAEDTMIFGDFSSLTIADFGSLELDCDDTTGRAAGNLFFRVWADLDWAIMDHSALTVVEKAAVAKSAK
ncbi:major capsid protein [Salmonella enterica subsp. enterica serovar Livingstone]|nr:major capsid protein [Salmonella enterica subsp. enterica serovar Livingstone]